MLETFRALIADIEARSADGVTMADMQELDQAQAMAAGSLQPAMAAPSLSITTRGGTIMSARAFDVGELAKYRANADAIEAEA